MNGSTMREWADRGLVSAFRTPGGHRRFARGDLTRLLDERGRHPTPEEMAERAVALLRRRFRGLGPVQDESLPLDEEARSRLRVLGRRLVEVAMRFHARPRRRAALLEEARFIGATYAGELRRLGFSLAAAVEFFLSRRSALLEAGEAVSVSGLSRQQALALLRDLAELSDAVVTAIAARYELSLEGTPGPPRAAAAALPL